MGIPRCVERTEFRRSLDTTSSSLRRNDHIASRTTRGVPETQTSRGDAGNHNVHRTQRRIWSAANSVAVCSYADYGQFEERQDDSAGKFWNRRAWWTGHFGIAE